jgi:hypothetical protein
MLKKTPVSAPNTNSNEQIGKSQIAILKSDFSAYSNTKLCLLCVYDDVTIWQALPDIELRSYATPLHYTPVFLYHVSL